eukprot:scaffold3272_cov239-Pinguiococcus_pyrenoidosus.AAC.3
MAFSAARHDESAWRRPALAAIRAFNVETAVIKDAISGNSDMGRIRIQFWRELIRDVFAGASLLQKIRREGTVTLQKWCRDRFAEGSRGRGLGSDLASASIV